MTDTLIIHKYECPCVNDITLSYRRDQHRASRYRPRFSAIRRCRSSTILDRRIETTARTVYKPDRHGKSIAAHVPDNSKACQAIR